MDTENDRTRSKQRAAKMSELTVKILDRQDLLDFIRWLPRFWQKMKTRERMAAWNAVEDAGCSSTDLEWALFFAIDGFDTASWVPGKLRAFHDTALDVLRAISRLRPHLRKLMESQVLHEPVWYQFFGFYELPTKQAWNFWAFQWKLASFEARLKQFTGKAKRTSTITQLKAECGSYWEAVFHLYVAETTGHLLHNETSLLLETAAEAYGLEGKEFTLAAVSRWYSRFLKTHSTQVDEIRRDIKDLWFERIENWRQMDLVPFLLERSRKRFQTQLRSNEVHPH